MVNIDSSNERKNLISSISFFCPAYHDEGNLPDLIPKVCALLPKISEKFEIIIVEDGSPDRTGQVAEQLARQFENIRVIHHSKNLGYGAALKTGFANAKYDYIMYTDGDNQYDVNEFLPYIDLLNEADVISGYAVKKAVLPLRKFQSWLYNWLIRILFFVNLRDINCSMKIYKKNVLDSIEIKSSSAFIDGEMMIKAKRAGFKIKQFPVTHFARQSGVASGAKARVVTSTFIDMIKLRLRIL